MPVACSKEFELTVVPCTFTPVYDVELTNNSGVVLYMVVPIVYASMRWWQGDWMAYDPFFHVGETRNYTVTPGYFQCGVETTICTGKEIGQGLQQVWSCLLCSQETFWPSPIMHFKGEIVKSTDAECNSQWAGNISGYRTNWTF